MEIISGSIISVNQVLKPFVRFYNRRKKLHSEKYKSLRNDIEGHLQDGFKEAKKVLLSEGTTPEIVKSMPSSLDTYDENIKGLQESEIFQLIWNNKFMQDEEFVALRNQGATKIKSFGEKLIEQLDDYQIEDHSKRLHNEKDYMIERFEENIHNLKNAILRILKELHEENPIFGTERNLELHSKIETALQSSRTINLSLLNNTLEKIIKRLT